jgi:hypothetical protein
LDNLLLKLNYKAINYKSKTQKHILIIMIKKQKTINNNKTQKHILIIINTTQKQLIILIKIQKHINNN